MMTRGVAVIGLLCGALGCEPAIVLGDDQGAEGSSESLSQPYATGTAVSLEVGGRSKSDITAVVSDDPAVFVVDRVDITDNSVTAKGRALSDGDTHVRLRDAAGRERLVVAVSTRTPDRARFFDHARLRTLGNDERARSGEAEVNAATVLTGGKAVFGVVYQLGTQRLYGQGIAEIGAPSEVMVTNETATHRPIGEWLFVTPSVDGGYSVAVRRGAATLGTLSVVAVPESAVTGLALVEQADAARAKPEDDVWVVAGGRDASGGTVLGVYCDFTLDGIAQVGKSVDDPTSGDLYRYVRAADGAPAKTLVARHAGLESSRSIAAASGHVMNTTYLGCDAVPGGERGRSGAAVAVLSLVALVWWLRRRASALPVRHSA